MSSQENITDTASSQLPPSGFSGPDDIPRKTNGAPIKTIDRGSDIMPRGLPQPPSKPQVLSTPSPSAAMAPSRAGTLSWQQRPSSRGSMGPSKRPLSMKASESNASISPNAAVDRTSTTDDDVSRSQISQSLGSKEPAWFKQTQDRGFGSAAFRRNQDDLSDTAAMMGSRQLPGMSRESTAEFEDRAGSAPGSGRSTSPLREGSIRGLSGLAPKHSNSSSLGSAGSIRSPLPTMSSQRFDPPSNASSSMGETSSIARTLAMSPSQGRLSPERMDRPASPTKGLGGFVQSAMLKRSDSVNKRWSAQPGPGLSRGNSIASNRSGYESTQYSMGGIPSLKDSKPSRMSREHSTETTSRPGSGHSNATLIQGQIEDAQTSHSESLASIKSDPSQDEASKLVPVDSKPPPSMNYDDNQPMMSPPASPSKKWSPTKASWLENAINKPDSPKVTLPAPQQPGWMAEINRAKQQHGSIDLPKGGHLREEAAGGLAPSSPPFAGYKPSGINGFPSGFNAGVSATPQVDSAGKVNERYEPPKITNGNGNPRESISPHTPLVGSERKANSFHNSPANEKYADSSSTKKLESQLGSRTQSPKTAKLQPETPPKIDLKSTLKSRQASEEAKSKDEPEFKNVFGNLKRTQTQNYKAPNELRDNILRGKARLATTDNPRRTERKDEFKESILKKKEGMVVPSASTRITSASSKLQENNVPEAIARRQGLTRSEKLLSSDSTERAVDPPKPEALARLQNLRDKPKAVSPEKPPTTTMNAKEDLAPSGSPGGDFASSLAGMLRRGPLAIADSGKPSIAHSSRDDQDMHIKVMPNDGEAASVGPQLKHATKARARGPKRRLPTANKHYAAEDTSLSQREHQLISSMAESTPAARSTQVTQPLALAHSVSKLESRPLSNITHHNNRKTSQPSSPRKPSTSVAQSLGFKTSSPTLHGYEEELQNKLPPTVKEKLNRSPKNSELPITFKSASEPLPNIPPKRPATQELLDSPSSLATDQEKLEPGPLELVRSTRSIKSVAAMSEPSPMQPFQPRSPVQIPTRKDEEAAQEEASLGLKVSAIGPVGLGIETPNDGPKPLVNIPSPVTPSPRSPPLPGKKPASIASRVVSTNLSSPAIIAPPSPATIHSKKPAQTHLPKASDLLTDLFDEHPSLKSNIGIDTQAVLSSRSSSNSSLKIKTLRKQQFEITENGKSLPVPSHQEHILFEDCLYLCTHVFGTLAGTRITEVYLWCGDGVPSSSIEDAQLFAKKAAKDNNGKLIVLKQGKETTNFFQALGGIVITRRGSSSRLESLSGTKATYILCGRQHVGQIAFDEVDFSPHSLCKGFPYIISARSGNLYLWKGSGSGADELGCARLIGMDLGLTGEIEEIDEGQEPDDFWQCFPEGKRDAAIGRGESAWHWHLKPSCEKYTTRLYRTDVEAPRPKSSSGFMQWGRRGSAPADTNPGTTVQIREIVPFAQLDLMDDGVFVLDAFFEVFM